MNIYNEKLDLLLNEQIVFFRENSPWRDAFKYCLKDGKLIRPKIALDICNTVSNGTRECGRSALCIEYVHAASLLFDDLPSMDNATTRRNKPCLHLQYNEAFSQLTSVVLISRSLHIILEDVEERYHKKELNADEAFLLSNTLTKTISKTMGHEGAAGGQFLDLYVSRNMHGHFDESCIDTSIENIILKKTGSFFELAFVVGWLIGGGSYSSLERIQNIANNFAMVYQITDDIEDMEDDQKNNSPNYANIYGKTKAIEDTKKFLKMFKRELKDLGLYSLFFIELYELMKKRIP
jgi:geranylgeranyl diphosphate synthase type II